MGGETRIQARNRAAILEAALGAFAARGFRGTTVDEIAQAAGLSKPNLLYYFNSKEAIHEALLDRLMDSWLDPLRAINPTGEPLEELIAYVRRKLDMSQRMPRESRLFANEILQGAPRIGPLLSSDLKALVDEKAALVNAWVQAGRIAPVHPYHLIFSIWSLTQHYADFEVQVHAVLPAEEAENPYPAAEEYLVNLFTKMLKPATA